MNRRIAKILIIAAAFAPALAQAQWTAPTAAPPSGNTTAPLNTSATAQVKAGGISVGSILTTGGASFTGSVGVGTASPGTKLDIEGGTAIIGTTGTGVSNRTVTFLNSGSAQVPFGAYPGNWTSALQIQSNDATPRFVWISPLDANSSSNARIMAANTGLDVYTNGSASTNGVLALSISTAGNVGIGVTPAYKLDVVGDINYTGTFRQNGVPVTLGGSQWTTNGASIYYNGGNVGVGIAAPTGKLDIIGTSASNTYTAPADQADLRILSSNNRGLDGAIIELGGSSGATGYIKTQALNNNAGAMTLGVRQTSNASIMQPTMTLDSSGNVGIGTTGPGYKLDVAGSIREVGGDFRSSGGGGWYNESYGGGFYMSDATWIRSYGSKNIWLGSGLLGSDGGLTVGYGGTTPNTSGGGIIAGSLGLGITGPDQKLGVNGNIHVYSGGTSAGYVYADGSEFGLLNNQGNWTQYTPNNTTSVIFTGAVSAASFNGPLNGNATSATNVSNLSGTWDGVSYFRSTKGSGSYVGGQSTYGLEALSSDGGAAGMSFHRGGYYAVNMGLDPDNVFRIGGWSAGANRFQLDMSGNITIPGYLSSASVCINGDCRGAWPATGISSESDTIDSVLSRGSSTGRVPTLSGGISMGSGSGSGLDFGFGTKVYREPSDGALNLNSQNGVVRVNGGIAVNGLITLPYNTTYNATWGESRIDTGNRDLRFRLGASGSQPAQVIFERTDGQSNWMSLSVNGGITASSLTLSGDGTINSESRIRFGGAGSGESIWSQRSGSYPLILSANGSDAVKVNNGEIYANGYPGSSDITLKKDISTISDALQKVLSLRGVNFTWKESGKKDIGVIAQEVEKVFPEAISNIPNSGGLKAVDYGHMVGPLIEAIKAQQAEIKALEQRISVLEAK